MFKTILLTELDANRNILLLVLAINVVLFTILGARGVEAYAFMGGTILSYWVGLSIVASKSGHEKRARLFAQLPIAPAQVYAAGWFFVIAWLTLQAVAWALYAMLFQENFSLTTLAEIASFELGALVFVLLIAIGIDLGAFRPAYIQLVYIFSMLLLLGSAIYFDVWFGIVGNDEGFHFYPMAHLGNTSVELISSLVLIIVLIATDFFVFRHSDHYLD